ncbi:MAG: GNAT family N-acetyltransferase [Anaerolineales bacterium]|nr:GNAT family N-acetyltransferase [Anaerolineales bacterium]
MDKQIDQLDHLAFADEKHDDPEFNSIDWSSHIEHMALGRMDNELVTLLGLLKREILVGERPVWVAGVGGVATHPNWQKRGFSSTLLKHQKNSCAKKWKSRLVCWFAPINADHFMDVPVGS